MSKLPIPHSYCARLPADLAAPEATLEGSGDVRPCSRLNNVGDRSGRARSSAVSSSSRRCHSAARSGRHLPGNQEPHDNSILVSGSLSVPGRIPPTPARLKPDQPTGYSHRAQIRGSRGGLHRRHPGGLPSNFCGLFADRWRRQATSGSSVKASTWAGRTTRGWRWSRVAISRTSSRSPSAITEASVVPSGRSS